MDTPTVLTSLLLLIVFNSQIVTGSCSIMCQDEAGNNVDWFVVYKLPKLSESSNAFVRNGSGWAYFGPSSSAWTQGQVPVAHPLSAVGRNIAQVYDNNSVSNKAYVLYNDQPPNQPTVSTGGHTKGVIVTDESRGIWIVHSIPHFPYGAGSTNFYPPTGYTNGQLFLCLSLTTAKLDGVGEILKYTRPNIFNYSIPSGMEAKLPILTSVAKNGARVKSAPWAKLFQLSVTNGLSFQIFAKGPKSKQEIYSEWIAPKLQTSLDVQSWLNGPNPLPSNCSSSSYSTYNILLKEVASQSFSTHQDHSKWAVGTATGNPWSCVADLNRMEHQLSRGGAALCTTNSKIWSMFSPMEKNLQPCSRPSSTES